HRKCRWLESPRLSRTGLSTFRLARFSPWLRTKRSQQATSLPKPDKLKFAFAWRDLVWRRLLFQEKKCRLYWPVAGFRLRGCRFPKNRFAMLYAPCVIPVLAATSFLLD